MRSIRAAQEIAEFLDDLPDFPAALRRARERGYERETFEGESLEDVVSAALEIAFQGWVERNG